MYKIKLTYKELSVEIESPTPTLAESKQYSQFITDLMREYDRTQTKESQEEVVEKPSPIDYNGPQTHKEHEKVIIRDRLPNRGANRVDLSTLDVQSSSSTAHSHFRCPECGQAAILYANGQPVVRDIVHEENCFSVDFDPHQSSELTYEYACENTIEHVRIMTGDGLESECPVCQAKYPTEKFVDAYYHPLRYFETEDLCPLCGGDLWLETQAGVTYLSCESPCVFKKEVQQD